MEKNSRNERQQDFPGVKFFYSARIIIEPLLCFKIAMGMEERWTKKCRNEQHPFEWKQNVIYSVRSRNFTLPNEAFFRRVSHFGYASSNFRSRTKVLARTVLS